MKFCHNCGTQLPDESKFCSACGSKQSVDYDVYTDKQQEPEHGGGNGKKLLYIILGVIVIAVIAIIFILSRRSAKEEAAREQAQTDSIAMVKQQAAQAAAIAEQARLDSIRKDSMEKAETMAFANSLPDPKKLLSKIDRERATYLQSLGMKGTIEFYDDEFEPGVTRGNYSISKSGRDCSISWSFDFPMETIEITITGDKAALDNFYQKAIKLRESYYEGGTFVEKKGNKVTITSGGV